MKRERGRDTRRYQLLATLIRTEQMNVRQAVRRPRLFQIPND